jgi:hypothetical protein
MLLDAGLAACGRFHGKGAMTALGWIGGQIHFR